MAKPQFILKVGQLKYESFFNVFKFSKDSDQLGWDVSKRLLCKARADSMARKVKRGSQVLYAHYGQIVGIKNIPQPKNLELVPYFLAGKTQASEVSQETNLGLDLRYNINSSTTLNMAFNPDFGQVEADPSVLNLSAFETRLDEKRPFFVQGANFLAAG